MPVARRSRSASANSQRTSGAKFSGNVVAGPSATASTLNPPRPGAADPSRRAGFIRWLVSVSPFAGTLAVYEFANADHALCVVEFGRG